MNPLNCHTPAVSFDASIAYILSDSPHYVRAAKNIPTFASLFRETHYIGCLRKKSWDGDDALPGVRYHVEQRALAMGAKSILSAIGFLGHVRRSLQAIRPDVVVATNEEYVLPFLAGYFPRPKYLVCDLSDSLAIRMMGPLRYAAPLWSYLSELAKREMDGMVEASDERLSRHLRKPEHTTVIYNSPRWSVVEPRCDLPSPFVYVCGSAVDDVSGVEALLAAVERIPGLMIVFAGRPTGHWLNGHFIRHPKVLNLGEVTPQESLRIAKASLAIMAHYKPFVTNYVFAAPNKLFDAMMLGVPLLINSECRASLMATRHGFGVVTPFGEADALRVALEQLRHERGALRRHCLAAQETFRREYAWENMERRWQLFFQELGIPRAGTGDFTTG